MKIKILSYPCKGWCIGKVGDAKWFSMPEPGMLVKFEGKCPHKTGFPGQPEHTTCFIENSQGKYQVLE
jgi:hypothetical protein